MKLDRFWTHHHAHESDCWDAVYNPKHHRVYFCCLYNLQCRQCLLAWPYHAQGVCAFSPGRFESNVLNVSTAWVLEMAFCAPPKPAEFDEMATEADFGVM